MSRCIFSEIFTPPPDSLQEITAVSVFKDLLPSMRGSCFPFENSELAKAAALPDPKVFRLLGRSAILLLKHYSSLSEVLAGLGCDPLDVGIYCAINQGVIDFASVKKMAEQGLEHLTEVLRKELPPKQIFKYGNSIPAAQLGIFLGVMGPVQTFLHRRYGVQHALVAAEADLQEGRIKAAIVAAAFSLEDPLLNLVVSELLPDRILAEGSAALVLTPGDGETPWEDRLRALDRSTGRERFDYGNADLLIRGLQKGWK